MTRATVIAVASDSGHNFSKPIKDKITLIEGLGVEGDAHLGTTVQHIHDKRKNPTAPNLRQVHLMHAELFDELGEKEIDVRPGEMGENVTTRGVDLLNLPKRTRLAFPSGASIEVTGLRFPCSQLNKVHPDLFEATLDRTRILGKRPYPKSGIMGIVTAGGDIHSDDAIEVIYPSKPHEALMPV